MASRTPSDVKGKNGVYFRKEMGDVTLSNADTFTLNGFSATTNLSNVYIIQKSDGSEMTNTHAAYNVVTVTGAGTDVPCVYLAYGVKA